MENFFISPDQVSEGEIRLEGGELHHLKDVLRYRVGDEVVAQDGTGMEYHCRVAAFEEGAALLSIQSCLAVSHELPVKISLYQALPKADKMELIIQKAVELGAERIVPVETARCVVKLDARKAEKKRERWQAIAASAAKQSGRSFIPQVGPLLSYEDALREIGQLDLALIPYERASGMEKTRQILGEAKTGKSVGILIGPEGGFEEGEVQRAVAAGAKEITLGRRILRTETAGMAVLAYLMLSLDTDEEEEVRP